ncbi:hypothetical protein [Vagococcus sp. CY52-2]|uniref:hypothetical protein n=1 Tax=Vagococcus sp. CY52-2 TaxID=2925838 RepID=UPI001F58A0F1|nr:hypothetical protein [Vagococcus sp. CY52-2]UNM88802.1 hypothetical protein MN187_05765 [Vagococcus sp. CY52-2]
MSKGLISIGSIIDYPTVHEKHVIGEVELILKNTVVVRDRFEDTHLVLIKTLEEDGMTVDDETYVYKNRYSRS